MNDTSALAAEFAFTPWVLFGMAVTCLACAGLFVYLLACALRATQNDEREDL